MTAATAKAARKPLSPGESPNPNGAPRGVNFSNLQPSITGAAIR
jgi:hypothetical protein